MAEVQLRGELDQTIWSKVPHDILLKIVEHSDPATQTNWSCTCRKVSLAASSRIWRSLRIRGSEITAYVLIVSGQRSTDRADGILHFLLESAYRNHKSWDHVFARDCVNGAFIYRPNGVERYTHLKQLTATLPISHVRDLEIDNQGFHDQNLICSQFDMDTLLPTLLKRLPILQSFKYVGPLSADTLAAIIQVGNLRLLQIRNGNDVLESHVPAPHVPWVDTALDLSMLSGLRGLQTLEVGRLIRAEAGGLAKVVASLDLRRLHVSCWGWDYANTIFKRSITRTSALVIFLDALMGLDLRGDKRGLPSTLKHLMLIDKYHSDIPSLHQLLATAILPCENLETLSTTINVNGKCYEKISNMGLPAYHRTIGLGSWQQLSCDGKMKVLYQYRGPSGEKFQTNPHFKPLCNIVKTLDQVIAATKGFGNYRMSMKFVRGRQFRTDEILISSCEDCEGELGRFAAERGPQGQDASMLDLVADFEELLLDEKWWMHVLRFWGIPTNPFETS